MEFFRLLDSQFIPIIDEPEQVTPVMEQQAVLLVGETSVVFPINIQIRTTQQHWGDVEVQFGKQPSNVIEVSLSYLIIIIIKVLHLHSTAWGKSST